LTTVINFAYKKYINVCKELNMRTTLNIEDKLIERAAKLTGIKEKTLLVKLGLKL